MQGININLLEKKIDNPQVGDAYYDELECIFYAYDGLKWNRLTNYVPEDNIKKKEERMINFLIMKGVIKTKDEYEEYIQSMDLMDELIRVGE